MSQTGADRRLALAVRLETLNLFQPCRECRRSNKWDVLPTNFNLNAAAYDFSTASEVWPRFTHINPQLQYSHNTGRCGDGVGPGRLSCVSAVGSISFGHGWASRVQPYCSARGLLPSPAILMADGQSWSRTIGDIIIAPAHADKSRRSGNRKSDDNRRAVNDAQQRARQLQQAQDAQKRLQEAEAVQKRIQQIQETVAAQQRRVQQLRQPDASHRKHQQVPIPNPRRHRSFPRSPSPCRRRDECRPPPVCPAGRHGEKQRPPSRCRPAGDAEAG